VSPDITADLTEDRVELSTVLAGNASFNNLFVAKLENMVAPEYHTQKFHVRDGITEEAQPINRGEKKKTRR
jgi:hypothetical protein